MGSLPWSERSNSVQSQNPHFLNTPRFICTQMYDSSSETYSTNFGRCQVKTSPLKQGLQQGALRHITTLSLYFFTFSMRQSTQKGSPLTATMALYSELICQSQLSQYTFRYFTASSVKPFQPCRPISNLQMQGLKCVKFRQLIRSWIWKELLTIASTCSLYHSQKFVFQNYQAYFATCWKMLAQLRRAYEVSWKCRNQRLAQKLNLFNRKGPKQTSRWPLELIARSRQFFEILMAPSSKRQALSFLKIWHDSKLICGSIASLWLRSQKCLRLARMHFAFMMFMRFHLSGLKRASRPDSRPSSYISKRLSTWANIRCRYSTISSYSLLQEGLVLRNQSPTSARQASLNCVPSTTGSRKRWSIRMEKVKLCRTVSG